MINISIQNKGLNEGRWPRPSHAILPCRGTRPEIFHFNRLNRIEGLIEPVYAEGALPKTLASSLRNSQPSAQF